jgi:hypothetical protein
MVATCSVAPRTGNVSAGMSIFAMVALERPLRACITKSRRHRRETPVAMAHCNNGVSELAAWAGLFGRFAAAAGHTGERRRDLRDAVDHHRNERPVNRLP